MKRLAAALGAVGLAQTAMACPIDGKGLTLISADANAPMAVALSDPPPISRPFEMQVQFCDDVSEMDFDAVMPAHQHGMNYRAEVASLGDNTYRVSNIVFHMPGIWELRVDVMSASRRFSYTGEVLVE